ncbi:MAG: class I SAM-dependent methyltransferase [Gemmatimonadota bacterium]
MTELDKVFVTGVYGSGKTRFARAYARRRGLPCFEFDLLHDYRSSENQSGRILGNLPGAFVIDAIPIDENHGWDGFAAYEARNDVLVVCVYCPDRDRWLRRIQEKEYRNDPRRGGRAALRLRYRIARLRLRPGYPLSIDTAHHLKEYRHFFTSNVACLSRFRHVLYYDSCRGEYTSREEMLRRVRFRNFFLEDHLAALGKDHDWKYQDIEILDFVGYSKSRETWKRIRRLVDWKGKRVVDLGCFHGYFCFKAEDAGARATGLDRSSSVLTVARMINELRGGSATFAEWVGGDEVPECDLVLCLNALHHFADPDKAVSRMRCGQAIFEIKEESRPVVERYFDVARRVRSHRADRCILLCRRRGG